MAQSIDQANAARKVLSSRLGQSNLSLFKIQELVRVVNGLVKRKKTVIKHLLAQVS